MPVHALVRAIGSRAGAALLVFAASLLLFPATAYADESVATVSSVDYPECVPDSCGAHGSPETPGTFVFTGSADIAGFRYGFRDPADSYVAAVGGVAEVTLTPPTFGMNVLFFQTVDGSGRLGDRYSYGFIVTRPSGPVAAWPLETRRGTTGPFLDGTGSGHDLAVFGNPVLTPDTRLIGAPTAVFDGDDHLATAGPVIRSDSSFTLSTWAKLDHLGGNATAISLDGAQVSAVRLEYAANPGAWCLSVRMTDAPAAPSLHTCQATPATKAWTHLTGTYDAVAGVIRLYVNGELTGERAVPAPTWNATGPVAVGRALCHAEACRAFDGGLADARLYDRAVDPREIREYLWNLPRLMTTEVVGSWSFNGDCCGTARDETAWNRELILGPGADIEAWGAGDVLRTGTGEAFAATAGPVVRTGDSFTVSAIAIPDAVNADATLLSQSGTAVSAFELGYRADVDAWCMTVRLSDAVDAPIRSACQDTPPDGGVVHLAGVYDAVADEIRLYVSGAAVAVTTVDAPLWNAGGGFTVGRGTLGAYVGRSLDVAVHWGALTDAEVAVLALS
ncbi:LamG domain-containing protein [Phytomonospora endophytica]|uniref:LamG-like jellyroll fold domain-containing protein n=1 Tax=Phytomonospora endophytica TaxID=714109 RepID=A0A841FY24_9ACTN|nr:LamG domain-containing protein [Phytomonospora endophytica]MBB6038257.1 hypothetical protein [Phytomonospora endophytica]GIG67283.1 hypothetical protein Pen01_35780 [Phytomonospora endophytica]